MERLKSMKETLVNCVQTQLGNLDNVDTEELGEVIDMIKDLEEAIYYCTITKAMEDKDKEEKYKTKEKEIHYYTEPYYPIEYNYNYRDMDRDQGRMYYHEGISGRGGTYNATMPLHYAMNDGNNGGGNRGGNNSGSTSASRNYTEREYDITGIRDNREGRSPMSRKTYMEAKEMHQPKTTQMKELEKYLQELSSDIVEMIQDASPEEKSFLEKKMTALANKIGQV